MQQDRKSLGSKVALGLGAGAIVVILALWLWRHELCQGMPRFGEWSASQLRLQNPPGTPAEVVPPPSGLALTLQDIASRLLADKNAGASHSQLDELKKSLRAAPAKEVSAAIRGFLDSKADAPTGQEFRIGANGFLDGAPTLRLFLLDYLVRIDPAAAAAYARIILSRMDSPDEWAMALRCLAVADTSTEGRAFLEGKLGELLHQESWQQAPSVGYLEAFDAVDEDRGGDEARRHMGLH